jgi:hypothetical protein
MGLFNGKKKVDPFSERARALTAEIAALEAKIKELDSRVQQAQSHPRLRSTARPHGVDDRGPNRSAREPVFEEVDHRRVKSPNAVENAPPHDERRIRKVDLAGAWKRLQNHFHGPPANNPKLVNYLAVGSVHGLRPLRYEKRVARNRVLALAVILLVVFWGIFAVFMKR